MATVFGYQPSAISHQSMLVLPDSRLPTSESSPTCRLRLDEIPVRRVPEQRGPGARPEAADVDARGRECLFPVEEDDRNLLQQQLLDLAVDVLALSEIE